MLRAARVEARIVAAGVAGGRGDAPSVTRYTHQRENGAIESVQRWWVYRVTEGRVASVASHASRHDACLDARAQHLESRPNGGGSSRR